MPQTSVLAITCFLCFALENLTEMFICLVLEEFAPVGNTRIVRNTCIIGISAKQRIADLD